MSTMKRELIMYLDQKFPPQQRSLIAEGVKGPDKITWDKVDWRRASQISALQDANGKLTIFGDGVSPHDVR